MHIFRNTDIDNELLSPFLTLKVFHNKTNHSTPDFFVHALRKDLVAKMYVYEQDPTIIFNDSIWWRSHSHIEQTPLSQSTLLSTLYVLYQYFRRPPRNEKASRRALEIQFLLYLRRYLFPPAFQALKHLLIREMFAFEKAVLVDGLLHLLDQFCPESVDKNLLGLYAPHLFCWLFEQSQNDLEIQDGFVKFQLMRYPNNSIPHYINDPVTIHDHVHDRDVLYERQEAERYKDVTRNVDLFTLIRHLQNPMHKDMIDIDTYTIDLWGCHEMQVIDRLNEDCISDHEKMMSRVYRSFTLLIRNALENSDVRDQLILVNNKQVGICFKRRRRFKGNGEVDDDLECFMPADLTRKGIVTLHNDDLSEVKLDGTNPGVLSPLLSNLSVRSKPLEQITLILLDVSKSMFKKTSDNYTTARRFLDIAKRILQIIGKNLYWYSQEHAIGIILFGRQTFNHRLITTNVNDFEKAAHTIPDSAHPWASIYDAMNSAIQQMDDYGLKRRVARDCKKLIICITHGIDNRGILNHAKMKQGTRHVPAVLDLILLPPDVQLYQPENRNEIANIRTLCDKSGGIVYRNSSLEPIDLVLTYGRKAVLSLKDRVKCKSVGFGNGTPIDWPVEKEPEKLHQAAVAARIPENMAHGLHSREDFFGRLHAEMIGIVRGKIENIQLYICRRTDGHLDYTFWKAILQVCQIG